jgi:hypothetical protein
MHAKRGLTAPGGILTSQSPPFTLPIRYMMLGVFGFGLFALDLVAQSAHLAVSDPFLPASVALTHLLTLASLLAFVMGAVYQLSTVAFLTSIVAPGVARSNFWLYSVSVAGLIASMATWWQTGLVVFGSFATLSLYLYASIVILSLRRSQVEGAMKGFVVSAHAYLILGVSAAWLMILSFRVPSLSRFLTELLITHILFAVGGFFSFLVMGFTFKLLPMFTLSHGYETGRQKWTLRLAHTSLWGILTGVWAHQSVFLWLGIGVGVAAFANQLRDIRNILTKRMRRKMEPPIRTAVMATCAGFIGVVLLLGVLGSRRGVVDWQSVISFYLMGWITWTVMSYAYKIVPFLVWNQRYGKQAGKGKVPLIADLIHLNQSWPVLTGFAAGLVVLTTGMVLQWGKVATIGSLFIAATILAFCYQMNRVIDVRKVGKELLGRD